jgi:hypothetical protein
MSGLLGKVVKISGMLPSSFRFSKRTFVGRQELIHTVPPVSGAHGTLQSPAQVKISMRELLDRVASPFHASALAVARSASMASRWWNIAFAMKL